MKDAKETERDIVRALEGSDAEMRAFVASLRAAPQARTAKEFTADVMAAVRAGEAERVRRPFWSVLTRLAAALPVAAGLALLFAVGSVFQRPAPAWTTARLVACQRPDGTFTASSAAPYVQAFAVTVLAKDPTVAPRALDSAVAALVREQNAEGGGARAMWWRLDRRRRRGRSTPSRPIGVGCAICGRMGLARSRWRTSSARQRRCPRAWGLRRTTASLAALPSALSAEDRTRPDMLYCCL